MTQETGGFTQERLDALERAISSGVLTIKYSDKLETFRSLKEMLTIRDLMRKNLGLVQKTTRVKAKFSKGLC